jgi:hypothetical protein
VVGLVLALGKHPILLHVLRPRRLDRGAHPAHRRLGICVKKTLLGDV